MACATLKRSLDWDAINPRPAKRRRCNPYGQRDNGCCSGACNAANQSITPRPVRDLNEKIPSPFVCSSIANMSAGKCCEWECLFFYLIFS